MLNLDAFTKDSDIVRKLLIGGLLAMTGIGMLAILGWMLEIMRRAQRQDTSLPAFDDIGGYFMDGLRASAVALIWSLPLIVIVTGMSLFSAAAPGLFTSEDDAAIVIIILTFCIVGLIFISLIPMLVLLVPAMGTLAETGSVREAISIGRAFRIFKANPVGFILAGLLGSVLNSVLASVGAILCLVGVFPAAVISYGLQGQLYGNAYREARKSAA